MNEENIMSAIASINATLEAISDKIEVVRKELEKMDAKLSTNNDTIITHGKDIEANGREIDRIWESLRTLEKEVGIKMTETRIAAVGEAINKAKVWVFSAMAPILIAFAAWAIKTYLIK